MKITDKSELTQKINLFIDGAERSFAQHYSIHADGEDTEVKMIVSGNVGENNTTRKFYGGGEEFNDVKDAFEAAGHEWRRSD